MRLSDRVEGMHPRSQAGGANIPGVLIVADNCSLRMGGQASLPFHYFRLLRERGAEVHLVAHERNRNELEMSLPGDRDWMHFVRDSLLQKTLYVLGKRLPNRLNRATFGFLAYMEVQVRQRHLIGRLVREKEIGVIHQPVPVSPAEPSLIFGIGVPVVIGPLNGGMDYPPGFRERESRSERVAVWIGRQLRHWANRFIPGKLHARILLVSNPRTRQMLPQGLRGEVSELVENGVDLSLWRRPDGRSGPADESVRFVYVGRLVDWKGVDLLLEAWAAVHRSLSVRLQIIGDGPLRGHLESLCDRLGLTDSVEFTGLLTQSGCARAWPRPMP